MYTNPQKEYLEKTEVFYAQYRDRYSTSKRKISNIMAGYFNAKQLALKQHYGERFMGAQGK